MKILLVEDEPFNLMVLEEMIKIFYTNIKIITAENGQVAYEILKTDLFDLILSDIDMPLMDGYALIKKIKGELNLQIPTIALTAFAIQGDKENLLLAGFDDYVPKPIDMKKLQLLLKKYLG